MGISVCNGDAPAPAAPSTENLIFSATMLAGRIQTRRLLTSFMSVLYLVHLRLNLCQNDTFFLLLLFELLLSDELDQFRAS